MHDRAVKCRKYFIHCSRYDHVLTEIILKPAHDKVWKGQLQLPKKNPRVLVALHALEMEISRKTHLFAAQQVYSWYSRPWYAKLEELLTKHDETFKFWNFPVHNTSVLFWNHSPRFTKARGQVEQVAFCVIDRTLRLS